MSGRVFLVRLRACIVLSLAVLAIPASSHQAASAQSASVDVGVGVGDTVLRLSGFASPNAFVTVSNQDGVIGSFTADNDGSFEREFPAQQPGINDLTLVARDVQDRLTDPVTTQVNLQQHFPTDVQVFLPSTLRLNPATVTAGTDLELNGYTIPGGNVIVTLDGGSFSTTVARDDGAWSLRLDTGRLAAGPHEVFVRVNDSSGAQSYPTSTRIFTVVRPEPASGPLPARAAPIVNLFVRPAAPQILSPQPDQRFSQTAITITGRGPALTQIEVWNGQTAIGSVWAGRDGYWSLPYNFLPGDYSIRARSCMDGRCGDFSDSRRFSTSTRQAIVQKLRGRLPTYSYTLGRGEPLNLRLSAVDGNPPYTAAVNWGDGNQENFPFDNELDPSHTYERAGRYNGRIVVSDNAGSHELRFAVYVTDNASADQRTVVAAVALTAAAVTAGSLAYRFGGRWQLRRS